MTSPVIPPHLFIALVILPHLPPTTSSSPPSPIPSLRRRNWRREKRSRGGRATTCPECSTINDDATARLRNSAESHRIRAEAIRIPRGVPPLENIQRRHGAWRWGEEGGNGAARRRTRRRTWRG
eukprot:7603260-Pyramimonas_sp.AAC.1